MSVCRTCLLDLSYTPHYSIDQTLENSNLKNNDSNTLKLRKMIEKCIPEMDMEICDSPVICEGCYKLLKSAYQLRTIGSKTEEKIYQYIEKNNLRLGESIDLHNLSEKDVDLYENLVTIKESDIKEESDVSKGQEMPILYPEIELRNEVSHGQQLIIKLYQISNSVLENVKNQHKVLKRNKVQSTLQTHRDNMNKSKEDSEKPSKYVRRLITCHKCQYKTSKLELLQKHLIMKCGVKDPIKYKCDKCSYTNIRRRRVEMHKLKHRPYGSNGGKPFGCDICEHSFRDKSYLKFHMMRVHKLKLKDEALPSFRCQEKGCKYVCPRQGDLNAHMVKHLKRCPYFCKGCDKMSFITKTELQKHEKICAEKSAGDEK